MKKTILTLGCIALMSTASLFAQEGETKPAREIQKVEAKSLNQKLDGQAKPIKAVDAKLQKEKPATSVKTEKVQERRVEPQTTVRQPATQELKNVKTMEKKELKVAPARKVEQKPVLKEATRK